MCLVGTLKNLSVNRDGTQDITISIQGNIEELYDELANEEVEVSIKKHSKRRSLDANAKAWMMIDLLAEKLKIKKTEVYQNAIREIGGVSDLVCVRDYAADTLCKNWSSHGIGWMTEKSPSKLPGCVNVTLWYGSSVYNTKQMSDLIGILIQECNNQGIPTMTEDEIKKTLALWGKKNE